jgi:MFS superfamily sulfate permease-like transporter
VSLIALQLLTLLKNNSPMVNNIMRFGSPITVIVIVATLVSWAIDLESTGVAVIGEIDGRFPLPQLPTTAGLGVREMISAAFTPAVTIATIIFLESNVAGREYAQKYNYAVSSNRELVALGMCNLIGSTLSCIPSSGSFVRSKVNDMAGGRTQLAGLISAVACLGLVLFLLPPLRYLPQATVSAIVVFSALHMAEHPIKELLFFVRLRAWKDLSLAVGMVFFTTTMGANNAIFIAFTTCLFLILRYNTLALHEHCANTTLMLRYHCVHTTQTLH